MRNTVLVLLCCIFTNRAYSIEPLVDETFDDFSSGYFDDAGQNFYVTHDGIIRAIHHYDLNQDGFLDLFFGNTHDTQALVPPIQAQISKARQVTPATLGPMGADRVRAVDLNGDGFIDLVFGLKDNGLQTSRRFITLVYGGPDGWPARRTTGVLPARNPLDIALPDLNADGKIDIVVINKDYVNSDFVPKENITLYWGADDGFLLSRYLNMAVPNAFALAAADFNKDDAADLAILTKDSQIHIFYSTADGMQNNFTREIIDLPGSHALCINSCDLNRDGLPDLLVGTSDSILYLVAAQAPAQWHTPKAIDAFPASHLASGFLDDDSYPDLVLTYFAVGTASLASTSGALDNMPDSFHVMWGTKEGFERAHACQLSGKFACASSIGDVDSDGYADLAVAIYQGKKTFKAHSLIYFGDGQRNFIVGTDSVATEGATDTLIIPASSDQVGTIIFCNKYSGTLYEQVPVYFYMGSPKGFSADNRLEIPGQSGHKASITDLNADGFLDFLVTFTAHGGEAALQNPIVGTNIFWGSQQGFDLENNRTILKEPWMDHCNIADLNRDGYLDIVLGGWDPWLGPDDGKPAELVIYYGSSKGIDSNQNVRIPTPGRSEDTVIADLNKDNWLDIAVTSYLENRVRIFWGSAGGFSQDNQESLTAISPIGMQTADVNDDGYLDLVVSNYSDRTNGFFDVGNFIFWGSPSGFSNFNSQWLSGNCTSSACIADFDADGHLDIFFPSYHAQETRENIPSYLYWGSPQSFSYNNKTVIICDSASGAFAGDFNKDGLLDLAISCHTQLGKHQTNSKVLYNDRQRFTQPAVQYLPTLGSHYMYVEDMGNIYHRRFEYRYHSSAKSWTGSASAAHLICQADIPDGAALSFMMRSASQSEELKNIPWRNLHDQKIILNPDDRFLQYQVTFTSSNGDAYADLNKVVITLN